MLNIYFTRHGETEWNKENRLQGWKNSKLTELGEKNAILLGERLCKLDLNKIYSSSSERALTTAQLICSYRDIPIHTIEGLKEISFGDWEGRTQSEIEMNDENEFSNFWNNPHEYNHLPHKAESLVDFKLRVEQTMAEILKENTSGNVLIVTHGVVIRAIMSFFWGIPTEKMWDPPFITGTSLSLVRWDGQQYEKVMVGDTSHMVEGVS